jgi:mediator of replication checkpoint protein 1
MLRRKRGGDFDELDDSDDDMADRRRRKQEEFARMRRALLADENVNKLAQNPKQEAFFHAIEDLDDFAGADFLDDGGDDDGVVPDTQTDDADEDKENRPVDAESQSQPVATKRKLIDAFAGDEKAESRPSKRTQAPAAARSKIFNPVELRKSLSFICDETVMVPATQIYSSDHEEDETDNEDIEIAGSLTISRSDTTDSLDSIASSRSANLNIVNRLIRRQSSLEMANSNQPLAFVAAGAQHSFKPPSLLRRATGLSTVSNSSNGSKSGSSKENVATTNGSNGSTKFGGSKKSNMHYQAKEAERRKLFEVVEAKKKKELQTLAAKGKSILGSWGNRGGNGGFE